MKKAMDTVNSHKIKEELHKDNFLIEYSSDINNDVCAIYFSSHSIWWPETEESFQRQIVEENKFEWYKRRIKYAKKHIFVRDIRKQFNVEGINDNCNSLNKLIEWLREETKGYKIVTVGSSAGGYVAALVGTALSANIMFCFSAQFSLKDDFAYLDKELLLLHENDAEYNKWYNISDNISEKMVYLYPYDCESDIIQSKLLIRNGQIVIPIKSNQHGVPMYHNLIDNFINMKYDNLREIFHDETICNKFEFAIKVGGVNKALWGLFLEYAIETAKIIKSIRTK